VESAAAPSATEVAEAGSTSGPLPFSIPEGVILLTGAAYLVSPWRWLDFAVFSLGAVLLRLSGRAAPPVEVAQGRRLRVEAALLGATLVFAGLMMWFGPSGTLPLGKLALTGAVYLPFAFLQQYMAQRYVVGRLARRACGENVLASAALGGLLFGLCHVSLPGLTLPTIVTGFVWAWAWISGARLFPLAISHALLGACYFIAVLERDPFRALGIP